MVGSELGKSLLMYTFFPKTIMTFCDVCEDSQSWTTSHGYPRQAESRSTGFGCRYLIETQFSSVSWVTDDRNATCIYNQVQLPVIQPLLDHLL